MNRPKGYFSGQSEMGSFFVQESDPGIGFVRVIWQPNGEVEDSKKFDTIIGQEAWDEVVSHKNKEREREAAQALIANGKKAKAAE